MASLTTSVLLRAKYTKFHLLLGAACFIYQADTFSTCHARTVVTREFGTSFQAVIGDAPFRNPLHVMMLIEASTVCFIYPSTSVGRFCEEAATGL